MLTKCGRLALSCFLVPIILLNLHGCSTNASENDDQRIVIDWELIAANPNMPLQSCSFFMCSGVQLMSGPIEEVVKGSTYHGMEGYEKDDINNLGDRIFKFMIRRRSQSEDVYSIILESQVKMRIELINFSGQVNGISEYAEGEQVIRLSPGDYEFQISGNHIN